MTADTDDRVVLAHRFKYVVALQAADLGDRPHLLRVETRAGHGVGKPINKVIEEVADIWAFAVLDEADFEGSGLTPMADRQPIAISACAAASVGRRRRPCGRRG